MEGNAPELPKAPVLVSEEPLSMEFTIKIQPTLRERIIRLKNNGRSRQVNDYLRALLETGVKAMEEQAAGLARSGPVG